MNRRLSCRLAAALALPVLGLGLVGPPSGFSDPGNPAPPIPNPELVALDQVRAVADPISALYKEPGFGRVRLDADRRQVIVSWHGTPPPEVTSAVGANDDGVTLTLKQVAFSDTQLDVRAQRLMDANRAAGQPIVHMIRKRPDMSGLVAYVAPEDLAQARKSAGPALDSTFTDRAGVAVDVAAGPAVKLQTRGDDSPPWQGGALIRFPNNSGATCTSGFSVLENGTGRGLFLTAGHCKLDPNTEAPVQTPIRDGAGDFIANNADMRWASGDESLIVDPDAVPGTIGEVYGGPWNVQPSHGRYDLHVGGDSVPSIDDYVCVSGMNLGERCGHQIIDTGVSFNCPGTTVNCHGFLYGGNGVTTASGDSGAPVYSKRADGRVGARGIHSGAVQFGASCPSSMRFPQALCGTVSIAVGIHQLKDRWNVQVEID